MIDLSNGLESASRVQVQAHWDAIADATYHLHQPTQEQFNRLKERAVKRNYPEAVDMVWEQTLDLFNFKPAYPLKEYGSSDFQVFLSPVPVSVGDVWELDSEGVLRFLRQFHPGATNMLSIFSRSTRKHEGMKACLRALSPEYADIVFRIHAEFRLNAPGTRLLPAQFAGRLVLNRHERTVCQFSLSLPARNSNMDINMLGAADIVFVPRMELCYLSDASLHDIAWEAAMSEQEACKKLARAFYKFAEIDWKPIEEAVELAVATNRPIHAVVLFGSLDDESC